MQQLDIFIDFHKAINIGGAVFYITDTVISTWIIMGLLIALAIVVRINISKWKDVPTGFQNVIEGIVELFENHLRTTVGGRLMFLGNWFFTVFLFVILSNFSGLIPGLRPPTADWSMTFALAIVTFVLIQVMGFKFRPREYTVNFFKPFFLFLPINIISELARPISLSFRLFGNILAGFIMMTLVYSITPWFTRFIIPSVLHIYFDLFAGALQAYVFVTLSMTFIAGAADIQEQPHSQ